MKKMTLAGFAVALMALLGCRTQIVTVDVVPADAKVIANGVEYNNKSPIFIEADTGKQLVITAYKEGYRDKLYVVDYSLSQLGKIEAYTSIFILPVFGLFFDTAWTLNENNITLTLEPLTDEAKREALITAPRVIYAPSPRVPVDQTDNPKAKDIFNQL
ncbi:MAG: hypothetical protein LBM70_07190 [Victivallales bacterium]|jgi:hypothetical protein|nr:hypothetical protein [Victivallales bacterium]